MTDKERYLFRRENGLCALCGKQVETDGCYCRECKAKNLEQRHKNVDYFRNSGLCTRCGQRKAFGNFKRCELCLEKSTLYLISHSNPEKQRLYAKQRRSKKKANGICAGCSNPAVPGRTRCQRHLNLEKMYSRKRRVYSTRDWRQEWLEKGLCKVCGSAEFVPGKKVCERCYSNCLAALEKAREKSSWNLGHNGDLFI